MSGGGSTPQQPVQTTTTQISPEAQALFGLAYPKLSAYAAGPPTQRWPGSTVAGFDPAQIAGQEQALGVAGTQGAIGQNAAALAGAIPGMLKWDLGSLATPFTPSPLTTSANIFSDQGIWNPGANQGLTDAINAATRPIYQNFQEQVMPAIRSQEISQGPFGGTRGSEGIAGGLAAARANQQALDTAAKMAQDEYAANLAAVNQRYGTNIGAENQRYATDLGTWLGARGQDITGTGQLYGQNLSALYQTLGLTPTLQQALTTPAATTSAVGDVRQQMAQSQLNDAINAYYYQQMAPYLQAKDILSLIPSIPGATTVSTGNVPQQNPWMQSLGGAMAGGSLGSMFGPMGSLFGAGGGALLPFLFR